MEVAVAELPDAAIEALGLTTVFPPGRHAFGIDCNDFAQGGAGIRYFEARVTAVALSDR